MRSRSCHCNYIQLKPTHILTVYTFFSLGCSSKFALPPWTVISSFGSSRFHSLVNSWTSNSGRVSYDRRTYYVFRIKINKWINLWKYVNILWFQTCALVGCAPPWNSMVPYASVGWVRVCLNGTQTSPGDPASMPAIVGCVVRDWPQQHLEIDIWNIKYLLLHRFAEKCFDLKYLIVKKTGFWLNITLLMLTWN